MDQKKTALYGAGQVGAMVMKLLPQSASAVCFIDSSEKRQGGAYNGLPILSPSDACALKPDVIMLCVTDSERAAEMEERLRNCGYSGEIVPACDIMRFDIRAAVVRLLSAEILSRGVEGSAAELGVYRGELSAVVNEALPDRRLHLFDTFEGFASSDVEAERKMGYSKASEGDFADTSVEAVFARLPHPEMASVHKGFFPDTFAGCEDEKFAFVSIDADLYEPTAAALPLFWERMTKGGAIVVHDYNSGRFAGVGAAVRSFCKERGIYPVPLCDLHGSAVLIKQGS